VKGSGTGTGFAILALVLALVALAPIPIDVWLAFGTRDDIGAGLALGVLRGLFGPLVAVAALIVGLCALLLSLAAFRLGTSRWLWVPALALSSLCVLGFVTLLGMSAVTPG
jgi:hypothetical protein